MAKQQPTSLTILTYDFIERIAWLEYNNRHTEADALRDLASWFMPAYRVDEAAVKERIDAFYQHTSMSSTSTLLSRHSQIGSASQKSKPKGFWARVFGGGGE